MRLVTYRSDRGARAGLLRDGQVIDAWDALGGPSARPTVRALLELDAVDRLRDIDGEGVPLDQVSLDVPVPDPDKIICIGLNYRSQAAEAGLDPPFAPTVLAMFR